MTKSVITRRVVIEAVAPEIDEGRYPAKRALGERVIVEADVFADGHDELAAALRYRAEGERIWKEAPMRPVVNDRWRGEFIAAKRGRYHFTLVGWVDRFATFRRDLRKKIEAEMDIATELLVAAELIDEARARAKGDDRRQLGGWLKTLRSENETEEKIALLLTEPLGEVMARLADRRAATEYEKELEVVVGREREVYGAWYEIFPRSWGPEPGRHATLREVERRLPYIASMGFDVLYFAPIHPIGRTCRKGKNGALACEADDPGSPWAVGSEAGGHKAVHPELGTLEDFRHFLAAAREHDLEVAFDLAYQCSPDHPYVKEHPEWFRRRPDGTIQYAENPPKKYQDIFPFDMECENRAALWEELKSIVLFWIEQGVEIFRVDNPHTKPFEFWEWMIGDVREKHPDVIFLAEAFTRPKVMQQLAKIGFTQSYTYFTWRTSKWELTQYLTELTRTEASEYLRPNFFVNTPDILHEYLQSGGRPAFMARLVLAATLGASYGIYGPAFELVEQTPREPGSEEYLDSEKYEIRAWDFERPDGLRHFVARVNQIRRDNPALHGNASLRFLLVDNDRIVGYAKRSDDGANVVIVIVNLDPHWAHAGWVELPLEALGIDPEAPYQVHDLLSDARYLWRGPRNYVELNPQVSPAHIFRVRRRERTEQDFDYYT